MAIVIPSPAPYTTPGEKRVGRLLSRLPEDWIVYYEPKIRRMSAHLHPDFVILAPAHGLLVLEVKDWSLWSICSINPHKFILRKGDQLYKHTSPLEQVTGYWRAIKDACRNERFGRELMAQDGSFEGQLCFPVGAAVVFPEVSAKAVQKSQHSPAWKSIFTATNSILADRLQEWETLDEAQFAEALRPMFQPFQMKREFTARQIDALRWVLFPETHMGVVLGEKPENRSEVLAVLDAKQEQYARSLGAGHRILFGVAGSGKTVLLMARARWLAHQQPRRRCLLLCYNKALAAWLAGRLADCPSVEVKHFDGWAKSLCITRQSNEQDADFGGRLLAHLEQQGQAARTLDAVLIDEAQDFEPSWFRCVLAATADPEQGDLVIVADGCQSLYKRGAVSWKALGIRAQGRSISARYDLNRNYRNTPAIAALASHFGTDRPADDGVAACRVSPRRCRRIGTSVPALVEAVDHGRQCDAALEIVGRWLSGQYRGGKMRPEEIGILYPRLTGGTRAELERLISGLSKLAPTRWLSDRRDHRSHEAVNDAAIKVQTIHSAKGLQYRAVILLWTDLLETVDGETNVERLLYVGITRAESELVMLGTGGRGVSGELRQHCERREYPFPPSRAVA